eukprot:141927_1
MTMKNMKQNHDIFTQFDKNRLDSAVRNCWTNGSKLYIKSRTLNKYFIAEVIETYTHHHQMNIIKVQFTYGFKFYTKIIDRHHCDVIPLMSDLNNKYEQNKLQFKFRRTSGLNIYKLEEIMHYLNDKNTNNINNIMQLRAIKTTVDIINNSKKTNDNWLTP